MLSKAHMLQMVRQRSLLSLRHMVCLASTLRMACMVCMVRMTHLGRRACMAGLRCVGRQGAMCRRPRVVGGATATCRCLHRTGHTLLEVLAVLSIAALLAAAALPSLQQMLARQQLRAAAGELFSAIELTRAQAMARGQRVLLMPADSGGMDWRTGWLVFIDRNASLAFDGGDELLFRQGPLAAGITAQFAFSSAAAPLYIAYNGAGRSCSATNSLAARWGTLSLALGKQQRHIKINMLGRVRVCDPQQQAANCSGVADGS